MTDYSYTWYFGKNPAYTIDVYTRWTEWALPLGIGWHTYTDPIVKRYFMFSIRFLCFGFNIAIWRYRR